MLHVKVEAQVRETIHAEMNQTSVDYEDCDGESQKFSS